MSYSQSRPLVSAIITVYNAESYLTETLENISRQTLQDIEIICVDDCSTDSSTSIVKQFADLDPRIKLHLCPQNLGAGGARNVGLNIASGDYVIFLDADDLYEPDMLETAWQAAAGNDLDILIFRSRGHDSITQLQFPMDWSIRTDLLPKKNIFSANEIEKDLFRSLIWWAWDKLIKREKILESNLKFQEIRTTNDLFFTAALFLTAERISFIENILIAHRFSVPGSLSNTREQSYNCCIKAVEKLRSFMLERNFYEARKIDFLNYIVHLFEWHINTISGNSYFSLFEEMKEYILFAGVESDFLYDDRLKGLYTEFTTLSASEYLFRIKDQSQRDAENLSHQLEIRNSDLHQSNRRLEEMEGQLNAERDALSSVKSELISMEAQFFSTRESLEQKEQILAEKNIELGDARLALAAMKMELDLLAKNLHAKNHELATTQESLKNSSQALSQVSADLSAVLSSTSWKITHPMRKVVNYFRHNK